MTTKLFLILLAVLLCLFYRLEQMYHGLVRVFQSIQYHVLNDVLNINKSLTFTSIIYLYFHKI